MAKVGASTLGVADDFTCSASVVCTTSQGYYSAEATVKQEQRRSATFEQRSAQISAGNKGLAALGLAWHLHALLGKVRH